MKLLAVETATEACSAALLIDGELRERFELAPQAHNRLILPMIESLLAEAELRLVQLDALAFGRGPGSFTGVRIATGVVQGLALGIDLPVAPVSTLAALAAHGLDAHPGSRLALACMDARMGEVYWGVYGADEPAMVSLLEAEQVLAPEQVGLVSAETGVAVGSGWKSYGETLCWALGAKSPDRVQPDALPRAAWIARLGAALYRDGGCVPADQVRPVYLRDRVARKMGGDY